MNTLDGVGIPQRPNTLSFAQRRRRLAWRISRPRNKRYAQLHGYYWLPCPVCGTHTGGHEARPGHSIQLTADKTTKTHICPLCAYEIGEAQQPQCTADKHRLVFVHTMLDRTDQNLGAGNFVIHGSFNLDLPPSHIYCGRCFLEFEPLTQQPIGRPTTAYKT